jgi:hypothetical protein
LTFLSGRGYLAPLFGLLAWKHFSKRPVEDGRNASFRFLSAASQEAAEEGA